MRRFVAAGFGVGFIPRKLWNGDTGAGTFGAALAALIGWALWTAPWWIDLIVAVAAILLSLWAAAPFAEDHADPNWVVIDEVAGTLVALIGLSNLGLAGRLGRFLFRLGRPLWGRTRRLRFFFFSGRPLRRFIDS